MLKEPSTDFFNVLLFHPFKHTTAYSTYIHCLHAERFLDNCTNEHIEANAEFSVLHKNT